MYLLANLVTVVFLVLLMLAIASASASARPPTAHVINAGALALPSATPANDPHLNHEEDASAQGLISSAGWR
ncbi:MAG: hypothetical protein RLZ81_225 [Pseudomonadota bacterium]|jgi:hypothetical protein